MKDFFQYRGSLTEGRMPRSVSAQIKYLDTLWTTVKSDFFKTGRNGTDFEIDKEVEKYLQDTGGYYKDIDWKKMSKQDIDLFEVAFEELWRYYGSQ